MNYRMQSAFKKKYIYWSVFKCFFILSQLIGLRIENEVNLHRSVYILLFVGLFIFLDFIVQMVYYLQKTISKKTKIKSSVSNRYLFFSTALTMTVLGFILLLIFYPGLITYDTATQLREAGGEIPLSDHHPVLLTFLFKLFCDPWKASENANPGIFLFLSIQIILLSVVCGYSVCLIHTITENVITARIIKWLFILNPMLWNYTIMAGKDSTVAVLFLFYICSVAEIVYIKNELTKRLFLQIFLSTMLASLIRHNCFYAFLFSVPILVIYLKKTKAHTLILYLTIIASVSLIHLWYYNSLNIERTSDGEKYTVFFQTTARMLYDHKDSLSEKELNVINNFMGDEDEIIRLYNRNLADPINNNLYNNSIEPKDKVRFFQQWFLLFFKFPKTYLKALANQDYGYFYLNYRKTIKPIFFITETIIYYPRITSYHFSLKNADFALTIENALNTIYNLPIINLILSLGFSSWLLIYLLVSGIVNKNKKYLVVIFQVFIYFFSILLGPANGYYRYMIPIIVCIPFLIGLNQKKQLPCIPAV